MKVSELGEFQLIDLLAEIVNRSRGRDSTSWQRVIIGIGDDAAVWSVDKPTQLATVDCLIQNVHFSLDTISWEDLGWKAIAVNLSDIAAMGGTPEFALVSLALPDCTEVESVATLYREMVELAQQFDVALVGGDVSRASLLTITVTVLGSAQNGKLLTRSSAIPGEKIAVTGCLGGAAAGLEMLAGGLQFDPEATACLRRRFLSPVPRMSEGRLLVAEGVKTAIDISDGLIADLNQICKASQVGASIEAEQVPVEPAVRANFGDRSTELALAGGEDYELLFTASPEVVNKVKRIASCLVTVIGEITAEKGIRVLDRHGNPLHLARTGWEHFVR
jgi:thiamine-monophosphate kinase